MSKENQGDTGTANRDSELRKGIRSLSRKSEAAKRIKEAVSSAGGLEAVAGRSGIPKDTLGNYTRGISEPKAGALVDIAEATGADLVWLATGRGAMAGSAAAVGFGDFLPGADELPFDPELMERVIVQCEESIFDAGGADPRLKARVIIQLYRTARREGRLDPP